MKVLKYLGQLVAALIYTPLYTQIMYLVTAIPVIWIATLSFWKMVMALIIVSAIIEGVIVALQILGLMPYAWISKGNKVAMGISVTICTLLTLYNIYKVWSILLQYGGASAIIIAIIISGLLLQFLYISVFGIIGMAEETKR